MDENDRFVAWFDALDEQSRSDAAAVRGLLLPAWLVTSLAACKIVVVPAELSDADGGRGYLMTARLREFLDRLHDSPPVGADRKAS
jgi:hypothetical protein